MKLGHLIFYLSVLFWFSCSNSEERKGKDLNGSHAMVQLIYMGEGEKGVVVIQQPSPNLERKILSDSILYKVLVKLQKEPTSKSVEQIKQRISVRQNERAGILEIRFYQEHPDYAVQFLETLVEVLNEEEIKETQREAKALVLKYEREIDSIAVILKETQSEQKMDPYELSLLLERYTKNDGSVSEAEKKKIKKMIEDNMPPEKAEKGISNREELEKTYTGLLEKRDEWQIKMAGYVPRIKMMDRPRWEEK